MAYISSSLRRLVAITLLVGVATACSPPPPTATESGATTPVSGGTLNWGVEVVPTTLNPHLNPQDKATLLLRNSYETLLARGEDGSFLPWLASAWQISDDGLHYSFQLRDGVRFSDGSALDAATAARNFEQLRQPDYLVATAHPTWSSKIAAIDTPDTHTLRFTLKQPYSPFLGLVGNIPLLASSAFDHPQLKVGGPALAGTGPFVLTEYQPGHRLEFTRNPHYQWAPASAGHQGPAHLDRLVYHFLAEPSVRIGALLSGQVDVIEGVPGQDAAALKANPGLSYYSALNPGTPYTLYFNSLHAPTDDVRVRQALVKGLDVSALVQSIYRGERTRAWGLTASIDPFYDASIENSYGNQPEQANALLDQAGWSERDAQGYRSRDGQRLRIELLVATAFLRDQRELLLLAIQAQARQQLGVELEYQQLDFGSFLQRGQAGHYGALANSSAIPDGVGIANSYLPRNAGGWLNLSRSEAPQLRQWLDAANANHDLQQRRQLYAQVQRSVLHELSLALPLYQPEDQLVAAKRVHGLGFRAFHRLPESAYDVWLEQ